ncbi:hypothetical protein ABD86_28490 [Paenibacillus alvei]|nr:hypothetical protein [Paenibacillus alvei]MBG9747701.1 hypothetical protein [Paenibacillus alvei]
MLEIRIRHRGLLHHETDLAIKEHYTDTAGYTDQIFGLAHLLGFRLAPRLRDLADSRLYAFGKTSDFPKLEKLLRGQINMKIIMRTTTRCCGEKFIRG